MYFQNVIETYNELKIIIGVNEEFNFIEDIMLNFDYKKSYSILQMKRNLKDFQYIDKQNIRKAQCNECKDIVEINNSAFLNILNGSTMSIKECKELFNDDTKKVFIMYKNNKKIGYSILEKNLIDTIAIHENFKLQGFGSKMVNFLLYKISEEYENAVLTVVDKNEQALNLYKKKGFIVDKVVSTWYEFLKLK
jgi:ribosomal protein S18 acetylase RimI-like enzyme